MRRSAPASTPGSLWSVRVSERSAAAAAGGNQTPLPAGQSAARFLPYFRGRCSRADSPICARGQGQPGLNTALPQWLPARRRSYAPLKVRKISIFKMFISGAFVPFEAETWGTPIEHEPEHIPVMPPELVIG